MSGYVLSLLALLEAAGTERALPDIRRTIDRETSSFAGEATKQQLRAGVEAWLEEDA